MKDIARLIGFELRKLLVPRVWIAMLLCFGLAGSYFYNHYPKGSMDSILTVARVEPELVAVHTGPIQEELAKRYEYRLYEEYAEVSEGSDEEKVNRILEQKYASAAFRFNEYQDYLKEIKQKKDELALQGTDKYAYKDMEKQVESMGSQKPPGFFVVRDWEHVFYLFSGMPGPGSLFMAIAMAVAISPLFAGEGNHRMNALLASSRYGRGKLIAAKLSAALLFTAGWVTLYYGGCLLISCLPFGFIGWDAPLNSFALFEFTPFVITQLEGFLIYYAVALLSSICFMFMLALCSAFSKSNLTSLGWALVLILCMLIPLPGVLGRLMRLLPNGVLLGRSVLERYDSYNVLNTPVQFLPLAIVVMLLVAVLAIALLPKAYNRSLKGA